MGGSPLRERLVGELFGYLEPLRPFYSRGCARLDLAGGATLYEHDVLSFEAWARQLWGLAPFWAGGGRSKDGFFEKAYLKGLEAGADPASPEYWGGFRDHDQRFVEVAALAYGLLLVPDVLWEPLSEDAKARLATWLLAVNRYEYPQGNWLWFRVLANLALRERGEAWDDQRLADDLATLDGFYRDNGWYQDGPGGVLDYYNAMTFHFFGLLYARLFGDRDAERAGVYQTRGARFARDYVLLFSSRGEPVPFGRSLTYRFAFAGFWSEALAARVDLGPGFSPGVLLGLVMRSIASFDRALVTDNAGVQSIGYKYPCLHMAEGYNGPGSPYWSLMAFACLALPEDDPIWRAIPESLPRLPSIAQTPLGLVARDGEGEVLLYRTGPLPQHPFAQSAAKYGKFVYSTRFGFSVSRSERTPEEAAPDGTLAFLVGGRVFVSEGATDSDVLRLSPEWVGSFGDLVEGNRELHEELGQRAAAGKLWETRLCWSPMPGVEVETEVVPLPQGHLRIHRVRTEDACEALDCGFAVPGNYHTLREEDIDAACEVRPLATPGEKVVIHAEGNTNISHPESVIPAVRYKVRKGETTLVSLVVC